MADGKVVIDTSLNNKGFTRGVNNLKGELGGLGSVVKKLGGLVVAAFSVKALVGFGKAAVELGSNVAEVQNVVDVAFGDMAYKIEDFAKTSIRSFGMSKLAAKETAANFMAMGRSMGLSAEAASNMAVAATGLTGDVASFFNISQDLAKVRLRGIWTGETEALKELGVVMTETNLKEYALAQGIEKSYDAMNQAERVTLRYQYVTDALSMASGDFIRTQDNWANQTRILSEQWKEFMSIVGQALITVLRPLVVTLNQVVAGMIDAANTINSVVTTLFGGTSTQMQQTQEDASGVGDAIEGSVDNEGDLTDAVEKTNKAAKKSLAAFDEINKLTGNAATGGEVETPSIPPIGGGGGITTTEGEKIEGLSQKLTAMLESLRSGFQELKGWVTDFFAPFKESWDTKGALVVESVKTAANSIGELLRSIGATFMNIWSNDTGVIILTTIHDIVAKVAQIAGTLAERFRAAWEANGNGEAIWRAILSVIQSVVSFVDRLATATLNWASGLNLEPIVSSFRRLLDAIGPLVDLILDGLNWAYENVLLPIASWVIEEAAPAAVDLLSAAIEALTPVIEALKPFAMWLWEEFLKPLGEWTGKIIIAALDGVTWALRRFGDWARDNQETIRGVATAIGVLLGTILAYCVAQKIPMIIEALSAAFKGLALGIGVVQPQALLAAAAIAAVVMTIMELAKCWDKMDGVQKVIAALGAVIAVAFAAALAVGAFQSALSMGIAVAAITAGIIAMTVAINSAKSQAERMGKLSAPSGVGGFGGGSSYALSTANLPHLAKGAVIPANREFLAVLGDQKSGTNYEVPDEKLRQLIREETAGMRGGESTTVVKFEGSLSQLARVLKPHIETETNRSGGRLVKGGAH